MDTANIRLSPYINFNGNTEEAMGFYGKIFDAKLEFTRFGDTEHGSKMTSDQKQKIMHSSLTSSSFVLMASDGMPGKSSPQESNIHLSLNFLNEKELDKKYALLSEGGQKTMPPHDAFWGGRFGMLVDKFGVSWMLHCEKPQP